jgi:hypothetical protein
MLQLKKTKSRMQPELMVIFFFYLATLPTLRKVLDSNPKSLVMLSHLGRPEGKKDLKYSMKPVAGYL